MAGIPTQVTFRVLRHSHALESDVLELPHKHQNSGRHVHVGIELTVPGGPPIVVSHEPSLHGSLKNVEEEAHHKGTETESVHQFGRVAIHEAFTVALRRLEDFAREQRGAVKTHDAYGPNPEGELGRG